VKLKWTISVAVLAAVLGGTQGASAAPVGRPAVPLGNVVTNVLTVNGPTALNGTVTTKGVLTENGAVVANSTTTMNGEVIVNMDATNDGVTIRGHEGSLKQPLRIFDAFGNPIAFFGSDGGGGMAGDNWTVFPRGSVDAIDAAVVLYWTGEIHFGGKGGPTLYGGPDDPNLFPPQHSRPFAAGDRFMWSGPNAAVFGWPTLIWNGSFWFNPASN
jgi:hypothetical protein